MIWETAQKTITTNCRLIHSGGNRLSKPMKVSRKTDKVQPVLESTVASSLNRSADGAAEDCFLLGLSCYFPCLARYSLGVRPTVFLNTLAK